MIKEILANWTRGFKMMLTLVGLLAAIVLLLLGPIGLGIYTNHGAYLFIYLIYAPFIFVTVVDNG